MTDSMSGDQSLESVSMLLPPVVLELVGLIGYRETQSLVARLGGVSFPVGKNINVKTGAHRISVLSDAVSVDAANKIMARFGGETLYIPRCAAALRELRNRRFIADYYAMLAAGKSGRIALMTLCPRFGFSDRYGQRLLARKTSGQLPLF
ncbi:hypothetical protein HX910_000754 [Salmonella enterica]|nr:hypothetical protein [Salmonella enterica]EFP4633782.1 hypothetical protein [Salmonella enterica]EFS0362242.1 hypothetical protein [Salmonella enterica]EGK1504552.1 hypothetical protein [Salmonella enterica]